MNKLNTKIPPDHTALRVALCGVCDFEIKMAGEAEAFLVAST